jgi:FemAB-related protein (PEP-CTERM system-associated)
VSETILSPSTSSVPIQIRSLNHAERVSWDHFVTGNSQATLYHLSCWGEIIQSSLGHSTELIGAYENNQLVGILPLTHCKTLFGDSLISMPFLNYGGVVAQSEQVRQLLHEDAKDRATSSNIPRIELRNTLSSGLGYNTKLEKATYILELADEETTFAAFRKATRNRLRKMTEYNLTVLRGNEHLEKFYSGFCVAMQEHGTPVLPKKFFQEVIRQFGDQVRLYVALDGNQVAGCKCTIRWRGTMYQIWGGYPHAHRNKLANYLLSWEATRDAISEGLKFCDFGRSSKESGPADFKRHFNCTEHQLYWEYPLAAADTELRTVNPKNAKFEAAISIWKKLPLPMTKLFGPTLSRHLP